MFPAWLPTAFPLWSLASDPVSRNHRPGWREVESPSLLGGGAGRDADGGVGSDAFDRWLNEKLHQLYGSVLREPIPEDLLELIEIHKNGGKQR